MALRWRYWTSLCESDRRRAQSVVMLRHWPILKAGLYRTRDGKGLTFRYLQLATEVFDVVKVSIPYLFSVTLPSPCLDDRWAFAL